MYCEVYDTDSLLAELVGSRVDNLPNGLQEVGFLNGLNVKSLLLIQVWQRK